MNNSNRLSSETHRRQVMNEDELTIRWARPADRDQIIELIDTVFREYDDRICLEGPDDDLVDIDQSYFQSGGEFWVLVDAADKVVGTHAALPTDKPGVCTFRRLYLAAPLRGTRWGEQLMLHNIEWARQHGYRRIEFWSDTRFSRAHRFFEKLGFRRGSEIKRTDTGWIPFDEYFYSLDVDPIDYRDHGVQT